MSFPELYLSKPGIALPAVAVDNEETVRRVRQLYKGDEAQWPQVQGAIEKMLARCNTRVRYLEPDHDARVADYAVAAAKHCLEVNNATLEDVDLVICGGIARNYFEPATAMEVAAKLGLKRTHAFDVTTACVGHLEAIQTAAAYLSVHEHYRTALVCTSELSAYYLSYDIQQVRDLATKFAGLTIGNGAACVLLRREPWPGGGIRLLQIRSHSVPSHWELCQVPLHGVLESSSFKLMRLRRLIPPLLIEDLARVHWSPSDVDHFVTHQPSEEEMRQIFTRIGADPERAVYSHRLYGNTASASVGVTYHQLLQERTLIEGDKMMLASAAAGFSLVVATGTWTQGKQ